MKPSDESPPATDTADADDPGTTGVADPVGADPAAPARPDTPTRRRGPRRAVRRGRERETVWGVTTDDEGGHGSNDDRLRRDVPPHW